MPVVNTAIRLFEVGAGPGICLLELPELAVMRVGQQFRRFRAY